MLTTSRREVTVDNIENESKEKLTFNDSALAREKYDFSGALVFFQHRYSFEAFRRGNGCVTDVGKRNGRGFFQSRPYAFL